MSFLVLAVLKETETVFVVQISRVNCLNKKPVNFLFTFLRLPKMDKIHIEIVKSKRSVSNEDVKDLVWNHVSKESK